MCHFCRLYSVHTPICTYNQHSCIIHRLDPCGWAVSWLTQCVCAIFTSHHHHHQHHQRLDDLSIAGSHHMCLLWWWWWCCGYFIFILYLYILNIYLYFHITDNQRDIYEGGGGHHLLPKDQPRHLDWIWMARRLGGGGGSGFGPKPISDDHHDCRKLWLSLPMFIINGRWLNWIIDWAVCVLIINCPLILIIFIFFGDNDHPRRRPLQLRHHHHQHIFS